MPFFGLANFAGLFSFQLLTFVCRTPLFKFFVIFTPGNAGRSTLLLHPEDHSQDTEPSGSQTLTMQATGRAVCAGRERAQAAAGRRRGLIPFGSYAAPRL